MVGAGESRSQSKPTPVSVAYSALSAEIGVLWLAHEQGVFRNHGLESNLVYAQRHYQASLAGEIHFSRRREAV
jgi:hypothetical protein